MLGQYGLTEQERWGGRGALDIGGSIGEASGPQDETERQQMLDHVRTCLGSSDTGGALAYLIDTPYGSIFYHDTSGCWTGVVQNLRPDVGIVAMAGRPNIDGEPIQGSLAQWVGSMSDMLKARRVVLGHHDDWMPPMTHDMTSADASPRSPMRSTTSRPAPNCSTSPRRPRRTLALRSHPCPSSD